MEKANQLQYTSSMHQFIELNYFSSKFHKTQSLKQNNKQYINKQLFTLQPTGALLLDTYLRYSTQLLFYNLHSQIRNI